MTDLEHVERMLKSAQVKYEIIRDPTLNVIGLEIVNTDQGDHGASTYWYFNLDGTLFTVENWHLEGFNMSKQFDKGERVSTPFGPGSVIYKRMAGPDYSAVEAYSICLDARKAESEQPPFPSYSGTILPAHQVISAISESEIDCLKNLADAELE